MKKHDDSLFRIGEVTKLLGITRKTLLVYEDMGLLTPAWKDQDSGYRYYNADNITQIRSIRSLQALGLSLKEISEYYYDIQSIDKHLQRLLNLRALLDRNIQMLQVRSARPGDLTVHRTQLPRQICFCQSHNCQDISEASAHLRDAYLAALRTGSMSMTARMFTIRLSPDPTVLDLRFCIPMEEDFDGSERMEFAETSALCIYFRGSYDKLSTAIEALAAYLREHEMTATGSFRAIYLEGPPNRGKDSANYITQIAVPVGNTATNE